MANLVLLINISPPHAFGLREEAGVPGKTPQRHAENMKLRQKDPSQVVELNSGPSCCEETAQTTVLPDQHLNGLLSQVQSFTLDLNRKEAVDFRVSKAKTKIPHPHGICLPIGHNLLQYRIPCYSTFTQFFLLNLHLCVCFF